MSADNNLSADEARFRTLSDELLAAVDRVVAGWIAGLVERRAEAAGLESAEVADRARRAGVAARDELLPVLTELLHADVDEQAVNPLLLLRAITGHAAEALTDLGVATPERDRFARDAFPDDVHGLFPATWSDIDESLHGPGIAWGAGKAFVIRTRRRSEGG